MLYCLAFTETWLTKKVDSGMISLPGFNQIRLDRQIKKRGGGLIFYIRNDWEKYDPHFPTADIEVFSVLIKRKHQKNLCISLTYIPPSANINLALDKLDLLGQLFEKNSL